MLLALTGAVTVAVASLAAFLRHNRAGCDDKASKGAAYD
jgi:hypothetical protein